MQGRLYKDDGCIQKFLITFTTTTTSLENLYVGMTFGILGIVF